MIPGNVTEKNKIMQTKICYKRYTKIIGGFKTTNPIPLRYLFS